MKPAFTPSGLVHTVTDGRTPGWWAEVVHNPATGVRWRLRSTDFTDAWRSADTVSQAMAAARASLMREGVRRLRYPVVCPTCSAPAGRACRSGSGRTISAVHAARRRG